jgi:hypothetical protein
VLRGWNAAQQPFALKSKSVASLPRQHRALLRTTRNSSKQTPTEIYSMDRRSLGTYEHCPTQFTNLLT